VTAQTSPVSFSATIKPYFTQLDRTMMMDSSHTGGFTIDLWDAAQVQQNFNLIAKVIARGQMPPPPPDSDGPWSQAKITQFGVDFAAWQAGGFQP
jgi:hypothetical protein